MNLIEQSMYVGSIYQALHKKMVTVDEILRYLVKIPVTPETVLAYRATCKYQKPDDHYIVDGESKNRFLTLQPHQEYQIVYAYSTGIVNLSWDELKGVNTAQIALLAKAMRSSDPLLDRRMRILCELPIINTTELRAEDFSLLFKARYPLVYTLPHQSVGFQKEAIDTDWIDLLGSKYTLDMLEKIRLRCVHLSTKAPQYWTSVVKSDYLSLVNKAVQNLKPTLSVLRKIKEVLPEVCPELDTYSDTAWKISLLPSMVQAYLLGFPLHIGMPSEAMIVSALKSLTHQDKYLSDLRKIYQETEKISIGPMGEAKLCNPQDVMLNNIYDYSSFDRLYYVSGNHAFCFTRIEFNDLLKHKKNPWNKEAIPDHIIELIRCRQQISKDLNLPPCEPLESLYEKVLDGTLSLTQPPPPDSSSETTFENFLMMAMMGSRSN